MVPGWRLGWIAINDRKNRFGNEIRAGLNALSQRIIGSNTIIQGAIPAILKNTPKSFFEENIDYICVRIIIYNLYILKIMANLFVE